MTGSNNRTVKINDHSVVFPATGVRACFVYFVIILCLSNLTMRIEHVYSKDVKRAGADPGF